MSDYWVLSACLVVAMGCNSADPVKDDPGPVSESPDEQQTAAEENEPEDEHRDKDEEFTAEVTEFDGEKYVLSLYGDGARIQSLERYAEAGAEPRVHDLFETNYCDSSALVVIVASDISTGVSTGTVYDNLIFDLPDKDLLAEYSGAEVVDRDDGSVISDDQPELERSLRDGVDDPERCHFR